MRFVWVICGLLCVGLGAVGAVTPFLPTVPLLLLAAFFFARSSERLHHWLIAHPVFGPPIYDWRERGAISTRSKRLAAVSIGIAFGLSVFLGLRPWVLALQAVVLVGVLIFIWTRPEA